MPAWLRAEAPPPVPPVNTGATPQPPRDVE